MDDGTCVAAAAPIVLLAVSELLPFVRRLTGRSNLAPTGIIDLLYILAVLLFTSGCLRNGLLGPVERLLGRDVAAASEAPHEGQKLADSEQNEGSGRSHAGAIVHG